MLRRLNKALPGLVLGIVVYGILLQLIGVWFAESPLQYSIGVWIGIGCALFMAIHMAMSIDDAVSIGSEKGAKQKGVASAMTRYLVVAIVLVLTFYFEIGSVLPTFFGVLGLKVSAYMQVIFARFIKKDSYDDASVTDEEHMA